EQAQRIFSHGWPRRATPYRIVQFINEHDSKLTMSSNILYRAKARRQDSANEAVVVHCSDHRFQKGFREFLSEGLALSSYAPLTIPGGGHFSSIEHLQPKLAKVGMQSLKFLIEKTGARRVILIGHEDCLFFKDHVQFEFAETNLNNKQIASLKRASRLIAERFPRNPVETYFVSAEATGSLTFLTIGV